MPTIPEFLRARFPDPQFSNHYIDLFGEYLDSGLAPPNVEAEIMTGDRGLYAHVWEAMLYRHLRLLGFGFHKGNVRRAGQRGPDFGIIHEGRTLWIEAIVASPEGIPDDYLRPPAPGEFRAGSFPHQQILLRWTSALRDKRAKLQRYVADAVIPNTEATVIAVNGCRTTGLGYQDNGITQLPFAVEAVFPVGPLAVRVNRNDGRVVGDGFHTARFTIEKPNGAHVPTDSFLNPEYANVSAILDCSRSHMCYGLPLAVVHNTLARVPLPHGLLGADKEYVADDEGKFYSLRRLN
jgi:type I restriction enzyme S subunit